MNKITPNYNGIRRLLNRKGRGRVLAMLTVIEKLDTQDIILLLDISKFRASEIIGDLIATSLVEEAKTSNVMVKGYSQNYISLVGDNIEEAKSIGVAYLTGPEFEKDKVNIEIMRKLDKLNGIKK